MRITLRPTAVVAVAALAFAGLAGCSTSSEGAAAKPAANPHAALLAAVKSTTDAGSAGLDGHITVKMGGQTIDMTMTGAMNFDGSAGNIKMDIPSQNVSTEELVVNKVLYMKMAIPGMPASMGNKWFVLDMSKLTKNAAALKQLGASGLPKLGDTFSALTSSKGVAKSAGTTTINGKTYTVYSVTVPGSELQKQLSALSGSLGSLLSTAASALNKATFDVKAYVNSDNQLAREVVHVVVPIQGQTLDETVDMGLTQIGSKVSVTAPPAADQVDFSTLLQGLSGS